MDTSDPLLYLLVATVVLGLIALIFFVFGGFWVSIFRNARAWQLRRRRRPQPAPFRIPPVVRYPPPSRPNPPPPRPPVTPAPGGTYAATPLLSRGEHAFYQALRTAIGTKYHITLKPRLADLVKVRQGRGFYRAFNQVAQKHIDFVLVDHTSMAVLLLLELDDSTHRQYQRRKRDALVNRVCREAGLQIMHIKARATYDPPVIRNIVEDRLRRVS